MISKCGNAITYIHHNINNFNKILFKDKNIDKFSTDKCSNHQPKMQKIFKTLKNTLVNQMLVTVK